MSRIGKKPITVPANVKIAHDASKRVVSIEGPKGKNAFGYRPEVQVEWQDAKRQIVCTVPDDKADDGFVRACWGTTRARLQSMVDGVATGYSKKLEVVGVGWSAKLSGKSLQLNVGYCNPVEFSVPAGVNCVIENNVITISGFDSQAVGQFAAEIRSKRTPEPYNGKGIKYSDEVVQRKQGKAFGA